MEFGFVVLGRQFNGVEIIPERLSVRNSSAQNVLFAGSQHKFVVVIWTPISIKKGDSCQYADGLVYFEKGLVFSNFRFRPANICHVYQNVPIHDASLIVGSRVRGVKLDATNNYFWPKVDNERLGSELYRSASFNSLPKNCSESEQKRPCSNSFGPCYEFVPPLRLILAVVCLSCAVAINGYGRDWIRLLCFLPILCAGWLILDGHRYWCKGEDGNYHEYSHSDFPKSLLIAERHRLSFGLAISVCKRWVSPKLAPTSSIIVRSMSACIRLPVLRMSIISRLVVDSEHAEGRCQCLTSLN
jgi:hypothetical protein